MSNKQTPKKTYDNAVVVRVRIKKARASMKDDFLTDELCSKYGIDKSSARVSKDIFKMTDINRPITRARSYLRENGVPWSATTEDEHGKKKQDATWVFNGRDVKELAEVMRESKEEFEAAVKSKADNWEDEIEDVRTRLAGAFNPADLPTREEFLSQFKWETEITPLRDMEDIEQDFRVSSLPQDVIDEQVARMQDAIGTKVSNVVRDLTQRVVREILGDGNKDKGILAGLKEYDPDPDDKRKGNTFRDSRLYGNMHELRDFTHHMGEVFPSSTDITDLASRLDRFCDDILPDDPEVVRTDEQVRKRVIQGLNGLLDPSKMPEPVDPVTVPDDPKDGFDQFVN